MSHVRTRAPLDARRGNNISLVEEEDAAHQHVVRGAAELVVVGRKEWKERDGRAEGMGLHALQRS